MRRYQYRLNDQNISKAGWGEVTPLKYIEVVPGETYGGTISVDAGTDLTAKMIKNRAYYDLYAFYCPIRLLWSEFPEFLASSEGEMQPPQTSSLFPQNFENDYVGRGGVVTRDTGTNAAFLRRMYYMTFFSFFHADKENDGKRHISQLVEKVRNGEYDEVNTLYNAHARSSTWDESWLTGESVQSQDIAVQDGSVKLDNIRRAYALDRWEKVRDYYGSRYTDLLKGYGIKADWGILQEPECIGISNNDFTFKPRSSSGDSSYGDRRGFFEGQFKLKLRKTFCPEHGIIGIFGVPRADLFNQTQGSHILCTRDLPSPSIFYDPLMWKAYGDQIAPSALIDQGANRELKLRMPLGEHLRKGRNEMALPYDTDWTKLPVLSKSMTAWTENHILWLYQSCVPQKSDFVSDDDVTHFTEVRVAKRSPVPPAGMMAQR